MDCATSPYVYVASANATGGPTENTRAFYAALLAVQVATLVGLTMHFRCTKNAYERTRVRRFAVLVVYALALGLGVGGGIFLPFVVGIERFPCWLTHLLCLSLNPMLMTGSMFRNANFALRTRWARLTLAMRGSTSFRDLHEAAAAAAEPQDDDVVVTNDHSTSARIISTPQNLWYSLSALVSKDHDVPATDMPRLTSALAFLRTRFGLVVFVVVTLLPFTIVNLLVVFVSDPHYACNGCVPLQHYPIIVTMCAEAIPMLMFALLVAERFSRLPDPWGFFRIEARLAVGWVGLGLVSIIVLAAVPPDHPMGGIFATPNVAVMTLVCGTMAFASMSTLPYATAMWKREPRRGGRPRLALTSMGSRQSSPATEKGSRTLTMSPQIGGVASSSLNHELAPSPGSAAKKKSIVATGKGGVLDGVSHVPHLIAMLSTPTGSAQLAAQLAAEWGEEALWFLEDAAVFRASFHDVSASTRLARARKICKTYMERGSMSEINISASQRAAVLAHVAAAEKDPSLLSRHAFDDVRKELAWVLENGAVMRLRVGSSSGGPVSGEP